MTKKPANKSIISSFSALSAASPGSQQSADNAPSESPPPARPLARVGAGVIGAAQRSLAEIREERDRLQAQVAKGGAMELDAGLVDPSPFPDRLPDDSAEAFEAFKKTLTDEGQKVPIQVRTHPTAPGRYQVVYGHRRWRAAKELGIPVKAILMDLSDAELAVAQGIENAVRQDLSWIERALFVWRMDEAGVKPRDIKAALAAHDADLARLRAVTQAVPVDVIEAIGRAPKVGRPRWMALANAISADPKALDRIRKTLTAVKVEGSDERFREALTVAVKVQPKKPDEITMRNEAGTVQGRAVFEKAEIRLKLEKGDGEAFAEFLRDELPALMEKFAARSGAE